MEEFEQTRRVAMMSESPYFEGDPATESARRHMERVLKEPERPRRWPAIVAVIVGAAAWYFWPRQATRQPSENPGPPRER